MEKEGGGVMRRGSVMEAGLLEEDGAEIKILENKNKISVTLSDSGFLSPAPNNSICSTVACSRSHQSRAEIKFLENKNKISLFSDSGILSPAPNTSTCSVVATSRPHQDDPSPYFLRTSSRCCYSTSTPVMPCYTTSKISSSLSSKSSPLLPSATSTPADRDNSSSGNKLEKRLKNFEEVSYSSDGCASLDSGIESLLSSPRNSTGSLSEDSVARASPERVSKNLGAVPKRRSPRQVARKVDGIQRLTKLKNFSPPSPDKTSDFVVPSLSEFEERRREKQQQPRSHPPPLLFAPPASKDGREKLDIVRCLFERDLSFPLDGVFRHLPPQDLCSLAQVSQMWNLALQTRKEHDTRRREFVTAKKLDRENWCDKQETRARSSPRRAMSEINRVSPSSKRDRNPSCNTLLSPSKIRHRLFVEEAAKLSPGERLVHCPLCTSPCRVTSPAPCATPPSPPRPSSSTPSLLQQATCSSDKCRFVFCPLCHCEEHQGRPCRVTRSGSKLPKSGAVTSKKSKARLRRL